MTYQGSCHCGQVAFTVEGKVEETLSCNCSICQRMGSLHWFVPRAQLQLHTPLDNLKPYTFGSATITHYFCPVCGIHTFGEGIDPATDAKIAAINVRCLEGVNLSTLTVKQFDGRAL